MLLLAEHGVSAHRRDGHPGLYVRGEKIMSVGLRCSRWVASHGASFNVNVDISLFDLIVSCGETDLRQTSLQAVAGRAFAMDEMKAACVDALGRVFGWELTPGTPGRPRGGGGVSGTSAATSCRGPHDCNAHGRIRTSDTWLRRPVLYPLSYVGMGYAARHIEAATGHYTRSSRATPFSGYGTTRESKSRGSSAPGKTSRASSRSSQAVWRELM